VTLTLTKTTGTSAVSVNVTRDHGAVKDNIKKFVAAYNDIVTFVNKETVYDATTKTGALLYNESTVKGFVSQLRQALSAPIAGLTIYRSTGEVGFKTNRDGTITLEDAKLDSVLSTNYNAVKSLFINQTTVAGVAQQVNLAIDAIDDVVSGSLTSRKSSLTKQINGLEDQISRKEASISAFQERLKVQYAKLDSLLSQLQGQSNFLTRLGQ
jgi:flagellar hook-associated protein 2